MVVVTGKAPEDVMDAKAQWYLISMSCVLYLDLALTICRGKEVGWTPRDWQHLPSRRRYKATIGFFAAILVYMWAIVLLVWGDYIYFNLDVPEIMNKKPIRIVDLKDFRDNKIEIKVPEEDHSKKNWLYTIMMCTTTVSFFHLILFILLAISCIVYISYAICGHYNEVREAKWRPAILWSIID